MCRQQFNEKKCFVKHLQKHTLDLELKVDSDVDLEGSSDVQFTANDVSNVYESQQQVLNEQQVIIDSEHVTLDSQHVTIESQQHVIIEPRYVTVDAQHVTIDSQHVTVADSEHVSDRVEASDCETVLLIEEVPQEVQIHSVQEAPYVQ